VLYLPGDVALQTLGLTDVALQTLGLTDVALQTLGSTDVAVQTLDDLKFLGVIRRTSFSIELP
jgi:hypothetical protein